MTRRTFTTKDANGCEFVCKSYHSDEGSVYVADGMGIESDNMKDLKKKVGNL